MIDAEARPPRHRADAWWCADAARSAMIHVTDHPDADLLASIRGFLDELPEDRGACQELDPRWLGVLRDAMGHQPIVLVARGDLCDRSIHGYLPLALVTSRLFGRFLVSLPYVNRAGIATDDRAIADALLERAVELAVEHDVDYLELRHHALRVDHPDLTHDRSDKVRMVLELPGDTDALWKGLDAKVRNQVRKGGKSNLSIRWGGVELLDGFYDVFAVNMRDLGTPVYPRRLFACILEAFAGEAELAVVMHEGQPIAGALLVHDDVRRSTQVPSASSLRAYQHTNANMWMYHHLLVRAIERGSRRFDFGRSSEGSGTWRFKKQWGAQPQPTTWQYHLRHGELNAARPDHPRYQRRIQTWQKLPVWLTRMIGPSIVRGIP